jgi:selenium metabolism protein YedF
MATTNCECQSDANNSKTTNLSAKIVVYINSATLGRGDNDLGATLMGVYLDTLANFAADISHVILINSGVKLACRNSAVTEQLLNLANTGISVLSCGTCLNHFKLADDLAVGSVSNMFEIIETMKDCGKTISP